MCSGTTGWLDERVEGDGGGGRGAAGRFAGAAAAVLCGRCDRDGEEVGRFDGAGGGAGFSFSAGLIDYVINWDLATRPWLIVPVGLCFAVLYYVIFRFAITKFDLRTPGREPEEEVEDSAKA
ncbi:hypothetical protein GCM10010255_73180 [Streptomyces coeruleofuscus]|uniref:Uncharacterized protein n=1 Tax=Streptomyces coeruleofuscus TaxID=66879 RepID=A0ABN3J4S2_9ACTN